MRSELTGLVYVVTHLRPDGSAEKKYDVTDDFNAILKSIDAERAKAIAEQALRG
jgi:hypothetical protein